MQPREKTKRYLQERSKRIDVIFIIQWIKKKEELQWIKKKRRSEKTTLWRCQTKQKRQFIHWNYSIDAVFFVRNKNAPEDLGDLFWRNLNSKIV